MNFLEESILKRDFQELPKGIFKILLDAAIYINISKIAIVGGFVRDLIIKSKNKNTQIKINDLDIVIEGDVLKYARKLQNLLGIKRVSILRNNEAYKTLELIIDDIKIDIASAREEKYPKAGENPTVKYTTINKDLIRRDFNINAIAFDLKEEKLIDLHFGLDAISNKKIDFLHCLSVTEDPTRIIRAARYSSRLDFKLSPESIKQIQTTINFWPWDWHIGDNPNLAPSGLSSRLRMELDLLFKNEPWEKAISNLKDWGALKILDPSLKFEENFQERIKLAKELNVQPLTAFIYGAEDPIALSERLQLAQEEKIIIKGGIKLRNYLKNIYSSNEYKDWTASKWTTVLEQKRLHKQSLALEAYTNNPLRKYLLNWLNNWSKLESPIKGDDLLAKGWEPGPEIGLEIKRQRMRLIDKISKI